MGVKFNPFTGNLDLIDTTAAAGADTQVQYNNGGSLAGSADLTWDDTAKELGVGGDINLDDGGTYATTLQLITPTANRTISFPDATGTVALVGGSSGQLVYNNAGAYAGAPSTSVGATGDITLSLAGAASTPPVSLTGTWFSGGTSTTTKPQLLIEPTGTTSTAWSTSGTGLGVNAASGFGGNLFDLQLNGSPRLSVTNAGTGGDQYGQLVLHGPAATQVRLGCTQANNFGISFSAVGEYVRFSPNTGFNFAGGLPIGFSNGGLTSTGVMDVRLYRDGAANTLAQRNGTNAQTYRLYGTYTDASNYVRAALSSTSTAVTLAAETAGTGADDIPLNLTAAGTGTVKVNSNLEVADAKDVVLGTTTGTKIGTATTQKLGFYNATPVVQPTAVADITTTATSGSLPTPDGTVTIADATTPTVTELLEYCVELEAKLEAALGHLRTLGLIAT